MLDGDARRLCGRARPPGGRRPRCRSPRAEVERTPRIAIGEPASCRSLQMAGVSGNASPSPAASCTDVGRCRSASEKTPGRSRWASTAAAPDRRTPAIGHIVARVRPGSTSPADRRATRQGPSAAVPTSACRVHSGRNRAPPSRPPGGASGQLRRAVSFRAICAPGGDVESLVRPRRRGHEGVEIDQV